MFWTNHCNKGTGKKGKKCYGSTAAVLLKGGHFLVQICPGEVLKFIFKVGTATEKVYSDNKQT